VTPTGSVVRPQRVSPCISRPPVRRDAGVGAVLTHEAFRKGRELQPFSKEQIIAASGAGPRRSRCLGHVLGQLHAVMKLLVRERLMLAAAIRQRHQSSSVCCPR